MSSAVGADILGTDWTRVENKAIRIIMGTTKDTPTEAIRLMRDFPLMQTIEKQGNNRPKHWGVSDAEGPRRSPRRNLRD